MKKILKTKFEVRYCLRQDNKKNNWEKKHREEKKNYRKKHWNTKKEKKTLYNIKENKYSVYKKYLKM